jgi:4-hydroxybenzoate polyprenyltransferase
MTTLVHRLWTYQAERFPLVKTVPLLVVFSASSVNVSAFLAGRDLPGWGAYAAAFVVALLLFFQLRVCDEIKDQEIDATYRPERPIPRGLVSLSLISGLGIATVPIAALATWAHAPAALWLLALVWIWLLAMTAEFGVSRWLTARPAIYLVSHMAIMPLIDLLLTGMEWVPGGGAAAALVLFLGLSFANGCVLEIGRKIWAPESEREGVDTYSQSWGISRSVTVWSLCIVAALLLLIGVGVSVGLGWIVGGIGTVAALLCLAVGRSFVTRPSIAGQRRLDALSGLWVLVCYALAGFAPLLWGAL